MRHSVVLDLKKCRGCTTCIKICATEAIRVRNGKATILPNRCIDCGSCIQICPHRAIKSVCDGFEVLKNYQYTVAVPDPALYGQFHNLDNVDIVLNGLLEIGFDDVFEAAAASELLVNADRQHVRDCKVPEISSSCPAVVRLISMCFPSLIDHMSPVITPSEFAAITARERAAEKSGLAPKEIGVFSIVPCSSQVTAIQSPIGLDHPVLDGAFAIRDVYLELLEPMHRLEAEKLKLLSNAGLAGVSWAYAGGEAASRKRDGYVAVDGIDNVIQVLEDIEDGRLPDVDFVELRACTQGCVGGCLNVENPFAAKMRIKKILSGQAVSRPQCVDGDRVWSVLRTVKRPEFLPSMQLDSNRLKAMEKMTRIQMLEHQLPGLRCGSCGAPSCRALAEDVVMGRASMDDCIFKVRERTQHMAGDADADEYLPAPFRQRKKEEPDGAEPEAAERSVHT